MCTACKRILSFLLKKLMVNRDATFNFAVMGAGCWSDYEGLFVKDETAGHGSRKWKDGRTSIFAWCLAY
jgi:hypothetical protein